MRMVATTFPYHLFFLPKHKSVIWDLTITFSMTSAGKYGPLGRSVTGGIGVRTHRFGVFPSGPVAALVDISHDDLGEVFLLLVVDLLVVEGFDLPEDGSVEEHEVGDLPEPSCRSGRRSPRAKTSATNSSSFPQSYS